MHALQMHYELYIVIGVLAKVMRGYRTYDDPMYNDYYSLTVKVLKKYRDSGTPPIQRHTAMTILVSDLPDSMVRSNGKPRKRRVLFMGHRDSGSNLVVRENGYLEAYQGIMTDRKGHAC